MQPREGLTQPPLCRLRLLGIYGGWHALVSLFVAFHKIDASAAIDVTPTATRYVSQFYADPKASNLVIDTDKRIVYVTGLESLNIFSLGENDTMELLNTQVFAGKNLKEVRWCANYISIIVNDVADPSASTLDIFKIYGQTDMVAVQQIPVGAYPGSHRITADCLTAIIPVGGLPYDIGAGEVDPAGTIKIVEFSRANLALATFTVTELTFDSFEANLDDLKSAGGLFEPSVPFTQGLQPLATCLCEDENHNDAYVALSANNLIAKVDLTAKRIVALWSLGLKDFSTGGGFDPNNKDGITLANYPIYASYSPTSLECFIDNGNDYFYTVNGGKPLYSNQIRLNALKLDSDVFPDTSFQTRALAGRLNVWGGDANQLGGVDKIIVQGARSMSLWNATSMTIVADSGSLMEETFEADAPDFFNSDSKFPNTIIADSVDFRSNNRGPEPISLAIFSVCTDRYHVIHTGLKAPGGILTFYVDTTDFAAGFTLDSLTLGMGSYSTSDTWGEAWTAEEATLLRVSGMTLLPARSPTLITASGHSSTVEAFKVTVTCSEL